MEDTLEDSFLKVDHLVFQNIDHCYDCGSTATVGLIRFEGAKRILYMANVGDSKAYICEESKVQELTYEHRGNDEDEIRRVEEAGGKMLVGRLEGFLAVTRSLGDFSLKEKVDMNLNKGLTAVPSQSKIILRMTHKWLILASDGLWDVFNPAVQF